MRGDLFSSFFNSDIYTGAKCDIIRLVFWVHRANSRSPINRSLKARSSRGNCAPVRGCANHVPKVRGTESREVWGGRGVEYQRARRCGKSGRMSRNGTVRNGAPCVWTGGGREGGDRTPRRVASRSFDNLIIFALLVGAFSPQTGAEGVNLPARLKPRLYEI